MERKKPKKLNERQMAIAVGITYPTLRGYRLRGCEGTTPEEVKAWREEHIGYGRETLGERANGSCKTHESDSQGLDEREQLAKIACKEAEARKREIENEVLMGELGRRDEYEQAGSELVNLIRARLELIPDECSAEAPSEYRTQERERLADKIHLILTEMSQWTLTTEE